MVYTEALRAFVSNGMGVRLPPAAQRRISILELHLSKDLALQSDPPFQNLPDFELEKMQSGE